MNILRHVNMDIVNIYGYLSNKAELVIGIGSYNSVKGLLTYSHSKDLLQMRLLSDIATPSVIEVIMTYESSPEDTRTYFSLSVKGTNRFIGARINPGDEVARAFITDERTIFWLDYSSVDNVPRSYLIAGVLYSLRVMIDGQEYVVSWDVEGFSSGDLVIFIPTTWYELIDQSCQVRTGIDTLTDKLSQSNFKGFTDRHWCDNISYVYYCTNDQECGECLGHCNGDDICLANIPARAFACGYSENCSQVTTAQGNSSSIGWIVIGLIIVAILLAWYFLK